jgi:hypothetical protein
MILPPKLKVSSNKKIVVISPLLFSVYVIGMKYLPPLSVTNCRQEILSQLNFLHTQESRMKPLTTFPRGSNSLPLGLIIGFYYILYVKKRVLYV